MDPNQIWEEYTTGKRTYQQLAQKYKCSVRTIQRKTDASNIIIEKKKPREVVILMDTTYWGDNFGVMLLITKENFLKYYVKYETNALYKKGIEELKSKGFIIVGIVCDGRRGLM